MEAVNILFLRPFFSQILIFNMSICLDTYDSYLQLKHIISCLLKCLFAEFNQIKLQQNIFNQFWVWGGFIS
jgi:hypothetical protein